MATTMATTIAKIFELSESEFNEEIRSCFEAVFKMTDEEKQQDIKEFVEEGGLDELLNCSPEEFKTLGEKMEAHDLHNDPQMHECIVAVWRYFLDNLETSQIKEILSKVIDEAQIEEILPKVMEGTDKISRVKYLEHLAAAKAIVEKRRVVAKGIAIVNRGRRARGLSPLPFR